MRRAITAHLAILLGTDDGLYRVGVVPTTGTGPTSSSTVAFRFPDGAGTWERIDGGTDDSSARRVFAHDGTDETAGLSSNVSRLAVV